MNNRHSLTKIVHAYKNYQRENKFPYFRCIEEFGFVALTHYSYNKFILFLKSLSPKRRQAIMRLGRAALKRKTFRSVIYFFPRVCYNGSPSAEIKTIQSKQDLRKIPFVIDETRKHHANCLKTTINKSRKYFTDAEIVCIVAESIREDKE